MSNSEIIVIFLILLIFSSAISYGIGVKVGNIQGQIEMFCSDKEYCILNGT